jgi:predicted MFS family arabinose efflux permease
VERPPRAARLATFVYFALDGALIGMWVVQIPAIEQRVGISHETLGTLLVLLGLGSVLGMQVAGRLADCLGTRVVVPAAGAFIGATVVLPGLARDPWALAGALLVFGFANGCLDVGMNAHAVHVERAYNRPIMSAFHAMWSIGGGVAAIVGAAAATVGLSPAATLGLAGAVAITAALVSARNLLPGVPVAEPAIASTSGTQRAPHRRRAASGIWILATLALMLMLCEGAANDWSALYLKDVLGVAASTAALGYATFAATMTIGRLLADRVAARFGPVAIVRYGSAVAAVGITIVAIAPGLWVALAGWALFGIGLSGCIPQLFSSAGHADPAAAGTNVSRVAGLGYLGMLAGPAVIGWMTNLVALNHAFLLLTVLCLIAAAIANIPALQTPQHSRDDAAHLTVGTAPS